MISPFWLGITIYLLVMFFLTNWFRKYHHDREKMAEKTVAESEKRVDDSANNLGERPNG